MKQFLRTFPIIIAAAMLSVLVGCSSSGTVQEAATADDASTATSQAAKNEAEKSENQTAETTDGAEAQKDGETAAETSQTAAEQPEAPKQAQYANVISKPGKVKNRGGFIKVLVNKQPVTNFDIRRRVNFLALRRTKGDRQQLAEQEMIEQTLKLQEAKSRRVLASDQEVNRAFESFAKSRKIPASRLALELNKLGVGADHFKEFIRTQLSWQKAVQGRFQAETAQMTERDVVTRLRKTGGEKPEVPEYNIQQVVFVVPAAKRTSSFLDARRKEALAFRQRFTNCGNTINLAKGLRDVSVLEHSRVLEPELPPRWKDEIKETDPNQTTRVRETDRGIEFVAVCNQRMVNDDRAAQITGQSAEFASFNEKGGELSQNYLNQIRSRATIIYQ